ncbi:MAG: hypothetical protein FWH20_02895 [Oscillospiraceae bacterium]|nr:hypothetical protein [Oscillospiraceae bacterium]
MGFFSPAKRIITTTQEHTLEQVRDALNQFGGFPGEAVIGGALGSKGVYFITYKAADVWIRVQKQKITVTCRQMPRTSNLVGGIVGGAIGGAVAGAMGSKSKAASWSEFLGKEKYSADDIVPLVADKLQQFFCP